MEVILIADVDSLGRRGAVLSVAGGYARNFLIPKRFAVQATAGNLRYVENQRLNWAKQETKEKSEAELLARALEAVPVSIAKKVGENDSLYGSVTSMEIAEFLVHKGFHIDRRKIRLEHPIKTLGEYKVPIKLYHDVTALVSLHVVREGGVAPPPGAGAVEPSHQEESTPEA